MSKAFPLDRQANQLERLLDDARSRLIDIGTRNRLIHTNRTGKRSYTLSVLHADTDHLFARLVGDNASLRFSPDQAASERERKRRATSDEAGEIDDDEGSVAAAVTPCRDGGADLLQTRLGLSALDKRLLKMLREAKTLEDEQGINILFLAIGFLRWYEDDNSQLLREAPLILVPVQISRDLRRSTFDLKARPEDIGANIALAELLRNDFGIVLPELNVEDGWTPSTYFEQVGDAVSTKQRWTIDASGLEVGFFSFAKLLMFTQLAGKNWPGQSLLSHKLLRGLMQEGFAPEPSPFRDDAKIDTLFEPSRLMHVLDADGSQTLAIETARTGGNLVVQGPPGTGKSQTIANIIAAAMHDGKTVLFVAEKMVALEVVSRRLEKAGLGAACLELHSRNANKRTFAQELGRTLGLVAAVPDIEDQTKRLTFARDTLNAHAARIHKAAGQCGVTPFQALGTLVRSRGTGFTSSRIGVPAVQDWSAAKTEQARQAITHLAERVGVSGARDRHAWFGIGRIDLQPMDLDRLARRMAECEQRLAATSDRTVDLVQKILSGEAISIGSVERLTGVLRQVAVAPAGTAGLAPILDPLHPRDLKLLSEVARSGAKMRLAQAAETPRSRPAASQGDHTGVRAGLARGVSSFFARLGSRYRQASAELGSWLEIPLPRKPRDRVALVDRLIELRGLQDDFAGREHDAIRLTGTFWQGADSDFDALGQACDWYARLRDGGFGRCVLPAIELLSTPVELPDLVSGLSGQAAEALASVEAILAELAVSNEAIFGQPDIRQVSLDALIQRLGHWTGALGTYDDWGSLIRADQAVRDLGLGGLADAAASGTIEADRLLGEFDLASAEAIWRAATLADPQLGQAAGWKLNQASGVFRDLEHARRDSVARLIAARHLERIPRGSLGEMAIIRGEAARLRSHMPIRKLMEKAGRSVQAIKPVFLMSPLSVAQFLPPGAIEFDLLVIDEASQVRPEDALGVIARSRQIVVVGDSKQLPPTNFFGRLMDDAADDSDGDDAEANTDQGVLGAARATELESILTLCSARGLNSRMLRWHYRSRHPSLIQVSNAEFYHSSLFLPPSPSAERGLEGFVHRRVQGVYDRGARRVNTIEARAVVEALCEHARVSPERTVGIVTFSVSQRDEVLRLLDEQRRTDAALDRFLTECSEEVFVKNLENVQGDERDVILISVCYGPSAAGAPFSTMSFGPVSTEGGERRLNVLFTRARLLCKVFVSFDSADIDLTRAKTEGARVLKHFLAFAETGILDQPYSTGEDADSPFEEDVAAVIASLGYAVEKQVGTAGFRIDLGVQAPECPGRYILAVECDGATYHSALWARERDRLRQEILEDRGWRFHRIWSTDWFYCRPAEIDRLKSALESARGSPPIPKPPIPATLVSAPGVTEMPARSRPTLPAYRLAYSAASMRGREPHEISAEAMAPIVMEIVAVEGPVHADEVGRRVAFLFGKHARTGIVKMVAGALEAALAKGQIVRLEDGFWCNVGQLQDCPVRNRSALTGASLKAEMLPPVEIEAAARLVLKENGSVLRDELTQGIARLLGFQRTGPDLKARIDQVVGRLAAERRIQQDAAGRFG